MKYLFKKTTMQRIEEFANKVSNKQKVIVIYGPTASGKTAMSIDIAKYLGTEIISTDSRQIFSYMDIGTGKILAEEMQWVTHHMIDIVTPDVEYSVWEFQKTAQAIIQKLHQNKKIPLLVGGTGLYIDSLIYDFSLPPFPHRPEIRSEIESLEKEEVYKKLQELDPETAQQIHPNNTRRVQRALEIYMITGKSKNDFVQTKDLKYDVLFLTPEYGSRAELYDKINTRVVSMVDSGLIDEIQWILNRGYTFDDFGLNTIGYKEFLPFLKNEISLEQAIEQVQQNSRNYAKRQLTWFHKYVNK